ncbi:MAG TPA: arginase family protein [Actinomycetota bacterium]|nr:arginase family protein [Actinomycetota bacterium]
MTSLRRLSVLDAPSNLGLRPPSEGAVPGCYKAPAALRGHSLLTRLGADDAGVVEPPPYRAEWRPGHGVRNGAAIASYSVALGERTGALLDDGAWPLVLGGDCSILVGNALALAERGRFGLVFVDGHSDFRHEGNAEAVGAAAGEDLAIVTGRGGALSRLNESEAYVREQDVAVLGIRPEDEYVEEVRQLGIPVRTAAEIRGRGRDVASETIRHMSLSGVEGYWIHVDVDVLDPSIMPAVDSPDPGGIFWSDLVDLLRPLLASSLATGMEVTVFDPDLDPDGSLAAALVEHVATAFEKSGNIGRG